MLTGGSQEGWRWGATSYYSTARTITIIEPGEKKDDVKGVPFGFGRAFAKKPSETERYLEAIERNGWEIP